MTLSSTLFVPPSWPVVPVKGVSDTYPVTRIFCVGRNYAEHAKEMGAEVDKEAPFYFLKSPLAVIPTGSTLSYPPGTTNYHYEMEFVVAIGRPTFKVSVNEATEAIYAYACGLDMTRRDLQLNARSKGRPWDLGKDFEQSAVISELVLKEEFGPISNQRITLRVGDTVRQDAQLSDLVWSVPEIISDLSGYYHLGPGDIIFTGTPAGVGPVIAGDSLSGAIEGLSPVTLQIKD